jgi:hypothetical protein
MVDNNYSVSFEDKVIVGGEQVGDTHGLWFSYTERIII